MKRLFLLTISNAALVLGLGLIGYFTNSEIFLSKMGINYKVLLAFCFIWGFTLSILSLLMSRFVAKWFLKVRIIDQKEPKLSYYEKKLLATVKKVADLTGVPMPQVGIYDSKEINAFATGPSVNKSLIAFTSNIFNFMDWEELEGVIAHEIAHIKNGDMVSMTLLQGLVNSFSMFMSRMISFSIINSIFGEKGKFFYFTYHIYNWVILFFETIFLWLGSFITNYYSRQREYRADMEAAQVIGKRKMIKTLYCLMKHEDYATYNQMQQDAYFARLKMSNNQVMFFGLLDTHPPMKKRIQRVMDADIPESLDDMTEVIPMSLNDLE